MNTSDIVKYAYDLDRAWLAGFIDGEGFIGIIYQLKKKTNTNSATPRYFPLLVIANCNRESLEYVKVILGEGKVYSVRNPDGKWKEAFQYRLTKQESLLQAL